MAMIVDDNISKASLSTTTEQLFLLARNPQTSSCLIQLPAELRIKVLRLLLRSPNPLTDLEEFGMESDGPDMTGYEQGIELSAQLLLCCQQLHSEGHQILYGENTLYIHFEWRNRIRPNLFYCDILGATTEIPEKMEYLNGFDDSLRYQADDYARNGDCSYDDRDSARQLAKMLPTIEKFQHFLDYLEVFDQEHLSIGCRVLQQLLFEKDVVFVFNDEAKVQWLKSCLLLRCRSARFTRFQAQDTQDLVHTITSAKVVGDTFLAWKKIRSLREQLSGIDSPSFDEAEQKLLDGFQQGFLDCNTQKTEVLHKKILERAIKWKAR